MRETLDILYQDEYVVAVHKPSGLLVHRSVLDAYETRFAMQIVRDQIGQRVWPAHRLDKGTSGVLLFALSPEMGRELGTQFETRAISKTYHALVRGWPEAHGTIDHALSRRFDDAELFGGSRDTTPQAALTHFHTLTRYTLPWQIDRYPECRYAWLRLEPETGRRHQIRRHLKHISHPIIGDSRYGKGVHNRQFAAELGSDRLLLAATQLTFAHPAHGQTIALTCPLAPELAQLLERLVPYEVDNP
ncbi:pseudouridine synthase [Chitinibacteraceae bacterium HSL-7]